MNAKIFISFLSALLTVNLSWAQNQEAADSLACKPQESMEVEHTDLLTTTDSLVRELQEVVVTAKQPVTKLVGATLVSTIPGSDLANLGNALDVLAQLPMIKVQDNTVSVIGKSNVEIYIDGRPMDGSWELQQILSSNLKKVELLMAPGAAYGSATGAVLRITTRRNFVKGLSLTEQLQLQRCRKWSVMDNLGLNYRAGSWDFFLNGIINRNNLLVKGSTTNSLVYEERETVVGSSQRNLYPTITGMIKAGFNYAKDSQFFGAYYRLSPEHGDFNNAGTEWLDNNPLLSREIDKRIRAHSHFASVYYENTFADKYLLHFDGDFKTSKADNRVATTYPDTSADDVNSTDCRNSTFWAGKLYLRCPLWNGDFTVGTQDSYTHTTLDYRMLNNKVGEYIPSSFTDARQTSSALFASWARMLGRFSLSLGARYEYVDYDFKVDGKRDENVSRRDHLLTPDLSLSCSFGDDAQISLSYRLPTVKPPYSQLTGSLSYVGLHEIEGGNPALRDGTSHDVQLLGMWKGFMLQANFMRSIDTYAFVKQLYPADNLQLLMHPVNIDVSALNFYLIWSKPISCWTPNITVGMYRQWLTLDNTNHNKPIFSYYFYNTLALPRGWTLTANINGLTQGDIHTNRFCTMWFTMDASVSKTFLNKALTVKLSATDIFNTVRNNWTMNTYGIFVDKCQSYDQRGVSLNVIYNFQPRKSKYKGASAAEEELKRL
ncbi:MAG: outer membrane beta-barrel protein [Prevotellaceae bacterium]|nr:outer membrane beta-barrel protein [Prevotellaceae bacterium]